MFFVYLFIFAIDLYIFQGIKTLTATLESDISRKLIYGIFWAVNIAFMALIALGFLTFDRAKGMKTYQIWAFNAFILVMIPKLVFALVLLGQDAVRLFGTVGNYALNQPNTEGGYMPERRVFISQLALGLAAIPFAGIIYGMMKGKYDYTVGIRCFSRICPKPLTV